MKKWKRLLINSRIQPGRNSTSSSTSSILNWSSVKSYESLWSKKKRKKNNNPFLPYIFLSNFHFQVFSCSAPISNENHSFVEKAKGKKKKKNIFNYSRLESMERVVAPDIIARRHKVAAIISIRRFSFLRLKARRNNWNDVGKDFDDCWVEIGLARRRGTSGTRHPRLSFNELEI